jgi:hypothetical protein
VEDSQQVLGDMGGIHLIPPCIVSSWGLNPCQPNKPSVRPSPARMCICILYAAKSEKKTMLQKVEDSSSICIPSRSLLRQLAPAREGSYHAEEPPPPLPRRRAILRHTLHHGVEEEGDPSSPRCGAPPHRLPQIWPPPLEQVAGPRCQDPPRIWPPLLL